MPDKLAVDFCNKGKGQRTRCAQGSDDELFRMAAMRRSREGGDGDILDGLGVAGGSSGRMHGRIRSASSIFHSPP
ncbi:hypothetical protein [Oryzomicrobium sp.]|uniref:hypothetical protein n=1 Tax=Oryzomicrobium sp. TaxID=1911578 RepID=UPI0025E6CB62|nr:hypothetical protein [Oryzomicrobium sp.]MCE1242742.1 hypothetical protein [Oryzomicrobium sp.]